MIDFILFCVQYEFCFFLIYVYLPYCIYLFFPLLQTLTELPLYELMPYGCSVVATKGILLGVRGRVVGPHTEHDTEKNLKSLRKKSPGSVGVRGNTVDVEFSVLPPESPFGHAIAEVIFIDF